MPILAQKWSYWILIYLVVAAALADVDKGWQALSWALAISVILQTSNLELIGKVKSDRTMLLTSGMQIVPPVLVYLGSTGALGWAVLWYVLSAFLLAVSSYLVLGNESDLAKGIPHYGLEASVTSWFAAIYVFAATGIGSSSGLTDLRAIVLSLIASAGLLCLVLLRNTRIVAVQPRGLGESRDHEKVVVPAETGLPALLRAVSWPSAVVGLMLTVLLVLVLVFHSAGLP